MRQVQQLPHLGYVPGDRRHRALTQDASTALQLGAGRRPHAALRRKALRSPGPHRTPEQGAQWTAGSTFRWARVAF
eukprot:13697859-Alexandrium_andersonii.AAC.1